MGGREVAHSSGVQRGLSGEMPLKGDLNERGGKATRLGLLSITVTKTPTKKNLGEECCIWIPGYSPLSGKPWQESRGNQAK